jgi:hypothetical protein
MNAFLLATDENTCFRRSEKSTKIEVIFSSAKLADENNMYFRRSQRPTKILDTLQYFRQLGQVADENTGRLLKKHIQHFS